MPISRRSLTSIRASRCSWAGDPTASGRAAIGGEEGGAWLGYLQEFPDYWTQGETLDDLKEHLRDLYADLTGGQLPGIRKVDDLVVS